MSIINLAEAAINDVPELELLPAGTEVEARLLNILKGEDRNEKRYLSPFFEAVDHPNVAEFSDFIYDPTEPKLTEKERDQARRRLRDLGEAFDIDWSGDVDIDEVRGNTRFVVVRVKPASEGYEASNAVSKYVVGH